MIDAQGTTIQAKMPKWVIGHADNQPPLFDIDAVGTMGFPETGQVTLVLVSEDRGEVRTFELSRGMAGVLIKVIQESFEDL